MNQKLNQHTAGPWRVNISGYISSDSGFVPIRSPFRENAFSAGDPSEDRSPVADANARLIAAAPDLLAELQEWSEYAVNRDIPFALIQATRAAIAKATVK